MRVYIVQYSVATRRYHCLRLMSGGVQTADVCVCRVSEWNDAWQYIAPIYAAMLPVATVRSAGISYINIDTLWPVECVECCRQTRTTAPVPPAHTRTKHFVLVGAIDICWILEVRWHAQCTRPRCLPYTTQTATIQRCSHGVKDREPHTLHMCDRMTSQSISLRFVLFSIYLKTFNTIFPHILSGFFYIKSNCFNIVTNNRCYDGMFFLKSFSNKQSIHL